MEEFFFEIESDRPERVLSMSSKAVIEAARRGRGGLLRLGDLFVFLALSVAASVALTSLSRSLRHRLGPLRSKSWSEGFADHNLIDDPTLSLLAS